MAGERASRLLLTGVAAAAVSLPFLAVRFTPVTDLPQLLAQVRLFGEALGVPDGPYEIRWTNPSSASFVVFAASWLVAPPVAAGRIAMILLGLVWVAGVHGLASHRDRPPEAALLASLVFLSHPTYWGFHGFVLGFAPFLLFFHATSARRGPPAPRTEGLQVLALSLLLYASHLLWLLAALAWLFAALVLFPVPWARRRAHVLGVAPAAGLAAFWIARAGAGEAPAPVWFHPASRLDANWWTSAILGGVRGPAEALLVCVFVLYLLFGALGNMRERSGTDRELLTLGGLLLLVAAFAPDNWIQTIELNSRWAPAGAACLLLGAPAPRWPSLLRSTAAVATAAVFALVTAAAWRRVESEELAGLDEALRSVPPASRVLGLDFVKQSRYVWRRPFLHAFAWAQVLKGCTPGFSFAELRAPLVGFRRGTPAPPGTPRLEWFAERVTPADLLRFDHAIVNAVEAAHAEIVLEGRLLPVTREGRFRLYAVRPAEGAVP